MNFHVVTIRSFISTASFNFGRRTNTRSSQVQNSTVIQNALMRLHFLFLFQFEEKFIETPADMEKLIKGNTKCLWYLLEAEDDFDG